MSSILPVDGTILKVALSGKTIAGAIKNRISAIKSIPDDHRTGLMIRSHIQKQFKPKVDFYKDLSAMAYGYGPDNGFAKEHIASKTRKQIRNIKENLLDKREINKSKGVVNHNTTDALNFANDAIYTHFDQPNGNPINVSLARNYRHALKAGEV